MFKKLYPFLKKYKWFAIFCPIVVFGEVILEIRIPILMSRIVDDGIPAGDISYVVKTGVLMVGMALLSMAFGMANSRLGSMASMGFGSELRRGLFEKIQTYSFKNLDHFSTASLVTRMTTDITNTQNAFMMCLRILVRAPLMLICAVTMAYTINASLMKIFLIALPFLAICLTVIATQAFPRFQKMLTKYDAMNASVQENLVAVRVVKAYVRAKHEKEKFRIANDDVMNASLRAERIIIFNSPIMQLTMYSCMISVLWLGGNQIMVGHMLTGELMSFISYISQILMSLMMISMAFVNLVMSRASIARIVQVLDEQPDITDETVPGDPAVASGEVEFQNVAFKYNETAEENTLEGVNLRIPAGATVGILGGTGSAKTSLVQLIPRLYDVSEGEVLVGGRNVKEYKIETLRAAVSMVLQKNVLFSGTIKDNLRWGNENATDEEIVTACKAAQAHDFIMSFPKGYDTDLGQGGVNVSGGQKQRLCIARAMLKAPKVLILDDSTSAVDTATDALIRGAFAKYLPGTTKIIIAQRVTSVCEADLIVVMDDGKISAVGTHAQLMENSDIYRDVYESQQQGVA